MDSILLNEFSQWENQMLRFVDHLQHLSKTPAGFATTPWAPQANIYEREEAYIILVELPGVDPFSSIKSEFFLFR